MKRKIVAESLAENLALWSGRAPFAVLDTLLPLIEARSIMAAERLGVFEALRQEPLLPAVLSTRLGLDEESLLLLLRVLLALGYLLDGPDSRYRLSPLARRTAIQGGLQQSVGFLRFNYAHWNAIQHLEELLLTGRGLDLHSTMSDTRDWENYQRAMLDVARPHAPILARHVPVSPGARQLVDWPAPTGFWAPPSAAGTRPCVRGFSSCPPRFPQPASSLARSDSTASSSTSRETCAGMSWDSDVDVILAANILHHFSPEENVALLHRARQALAPGGTLAIWDIERRPDGARAELGRDASALFFRLTSTSRCYSAAEFREWLGAAGLAPARVVRSPLAPLHLLVLARNEP